MKILHTDKDENPAVEIPAEQFIQKIQEPIDVTTGQPATPVETPKKNNNKIWAVVIVLALAIVATLIVYFKLKAKKENEHIGN